jgi:hypothetical protein
MFRGPVGSLAKDIAEFSSDYLDDEVIRYAERYIKAYSENQNKFLNSLNTSDMSELSETDVEALDFAWENFGKYDTQSLINITHRYPEWLKHESELANQKRIPIDITDFFEDPIDLKDDPFLLDTNILNNSREIFAEYN